MNIPVTNSNPCTSVNVNEAAGANPSNINNISPAASEYWCTILVEADCEDYPKRYAWLQSDVTTSCIKFVPIPDDVPSDITVTFTETCESCNDNQNGGCNYSREIFRDVVLLSGIEGYTYINLSYLQSDCSIYSNCK